MIQRRNFLLLGASALASANALPAWARQNKIAPVEPSGGRGGRIIPVTTLSPTGPGSITEAIRAKGARIVVFEVGGVIDLAKTSLKIVNGDLTLAGQTAPAPGVTLIRGGVEIGQDCANVVITHIAVRPGEAGAAKGAGWECDGVYAYGASRVLVGNCSITWATDEGLSASGKRFGLDNAGATLADWRAATSHDIVFRNNIVAEGLSHSTHSKGEHSKGTLLHDNVRNVLIERSLYAHNVERNVLFKGGVSGLVRQNVVYNPAKRFTHFNLNAADWEGRPFEATQAEIIENIYLAGPSTDAKAVAFNLGGEGPLDLTMRDNLALDVKGAPLPQFGRSGSKAAALTDRDGPGARVNPPDTTKLTAILADVLATCGARPWDHDPIDARIVADVTRGTGRIINSEQDVGGYPIRPRTHAPFVAAEWSLDRMERKT
jgi:hypothetical protein